MHLCAFHRAPSVLLACLGGLFAAPFRFDNTIQSPSAVANRRRRRDSPVPAPVFCSGGECKIVPFQCFRLWEGGKQRAPFCCVKTPLGLLPGVASAVRFRAPSRNDAAAVKSNLSVVVAVMPTAIAEVAQNRVKKKEKPDLGGKALFSGYTQKIVRPSSLLRIRVQWATVHVCA
ncbi:hypothetical protein CpipJ_CPIJ007941 [Culex quinquefasciatus]|uniref:Secreted protein n=1 Tax=Culex quinquefasciatus TaxID=7176 RepID=B0WM09_CULQU|nr:hypothetical protein CpipJ_CPIJ007941 [Culex quinquefasciatus]|eukprot:XP_001849743.1 hypothetical protein CpipJ_CPIJ007941 [Culex quinquefasciatus]